MTDMFHIKAIELISKSLEVEVANEKRRTGKVWALGQYIAGMGFSNVGLENRVYGTYTWAVYDTHMKFCCAMMLRS